MVTTQPGLIRSAPVRTNSRCSLWRSELDELAFAGLMVLPGLVALGVVLWVIVAVVLR